MTLRDELTRLHSDENSRDKRATQAFATIAGRLRAYARQGYREIVFDAAHPMGIPALRDPAVRKAVADMLRDGGLTVIEKYYAIKVKW